jgi:hypothetical protein
VEDRRIRELLFHEKEFSIVPSLMIIVYLCTHISKTKQDMEVVSIERSTYEELLMSFNSFVTKMKEMASISNDKRLGEWLDNQDVCQMLNISPRTLQTLRDNGTLAYSQINRKVYYKPEDVESILHVVAGRDKDSKMYNLKTERL